MKAKRYIKYVKVCLNIYSHHFRCYFLRLETIVLSDVIACIQLEENYLIVCTLEYIYG